MATSIELAEIAAGLLGLPVSNVVQHLRNLQKDKRITFKGYGRGAAQMTPPDAARLLIAAAGSSFTKDSLETLDTFGELLPIGYDKREGPYITLESHLAGLLAKLASDKYLVGRQENPQADRISNSGLMLMSVVSLDERRYPRVAISRWGWTGQTAISFATPGWKSPVIDVADYAVQMEGAGLIRVMTVTKTAMEKLAVSL